MNVPFEVMKLTMQKEKARRISFREVFSQIRAQHGWRGFYRGTLITQMRDIPSYALVFSVFEGVQHLLRDHMHGAKIIPI